MKQSIMFDAPDDNDGLVIIGIARDAPGTQSHSTFRKIDMASKTGKLISFEWGEIMVMLPRTLYDQFYAHVTHADHESRAAAVIALLEGGLSCSE
mgnify:CR=1 FL=1